MAADFKLFGTDEFKLASLNSLQSYNSISWIINYNTKLVRLIVILTKEL